MNDITYAYIGGLTKSRDDKGFLTVKGLATDDTLDLDQQICDPEFLKAEMPKWFKIGNIREQHGSNAVGKATGMGAKGTGYEIAAKIVDPLAALKVEEEIYTGFSIGIKGAFVDYNDPRAPKGVIKGGTIVEVSVVDRPANPSCSFEMAKMVGGTLVKDFAVGEVTDAEGENPCPKCMATGKIFEDNKYIICPTCEGSGTYGSEQVADEAPYAGESQTDAPKSADPETEVVEGDEAKREFSDKERADAASAGQALPDGSYPIKTVADLKNAIQSFGRAKDPAKVKAHIKTRAKALGREDLIPDNWKSAEPDVTKDASLEHDPADLQAVRTSLISLIKAELDEMASGDENEIPDVRQLLASLDLFLSWWDGEADENETTQPFTEESDDNMAYIQLGVSADLIKSATATDATDETKTELRSEIRKALGVDEETANLKASLEELREANESLKAALEDVRKMAAPGGPALRATNVQQARSAEADELEARAQKFMAIAKDSTDKSTAGQYVLAADDLIKQAKSLRSQLN